MKDFNLLPSLLLCFALSSCAQQDKETYKDKATVEEQAKTEAEREVREKRAAAMEKDLSDRHFFYGSIEGKYEGQVKVGEESYNIKITFVRSLPPYEGNRVRELSEIESDLNNLYFVVQVIQWHPLDPETAVGCRVSGVRPNMDEGTVVIASSECPNLYDLYLAEEKSLIMSKENSTHIAKQVRDRHLLSVTHLSGAVQPSSNAGSFRFLVKKLNR